MSAYNLVLFDLDGTIIETHDGITNSFQYALNKMGVHEPDSKRLIKFVGYPLREILHEYYGFNQQQVDKTMTYYREKYNQKGIYESQVYPHIVDLLTSLKQQDKKLVIATTKITGFAKKILKNYQLYDFFDRIEGSTLNDYRVSKTEIIEYILDHYKSFEKKECIMIGDREQDIIGAKNTGIDSIGVTYGYGTKKELETAKPTYIVNSGKNVEKILL